MDGADGSTGVNPLDLGERIGVLVQRDAASLAGAVIDLLGDPKRRAEMGRIGRASNKSMPA